MNIEDLFSSLRSLAGEAVLSGRAWWPLLWLGVVILLTAWALARLAPWLGVLGREGESTSIRRSRAFTLAGVIVLGVAMAEMALISLPLVAFVVVAIVLPIVFVATGVIQDLTGGLATEFRLRPGLGDRIRVGDISGHLVRVGVLRTRLQVDDGGDVFVPNRLFVREPVYLEPARSGRDLVVSVPARSWTAADIAELRSHVALLPYRVPGAPVEFETTEQALTISTRVWLAPGDDLADRAVRRACEAIATTPSE